MKNRRKQKRGISYEIERQGVKIRKKQSRKKQKINKNCMK